MEEKLPFELPKFDNVKDDGTDLGTFKSAKTLKEAYDNLRSCFTKNAMELAEIKKNLVTNSQNAENCEEDCAKSGENTENEPQNAQNEPENNDLNAIKPEISNSNEGVIAGENASDKAEIVPDSSDKTDVPEKNGEVWDNTDWSQNIEKFFVKNPSAKDYANEIAKELMQDKEAQNSSDPLLQAWVRVLEKKSQNLVLSDDFIEKNILSNQKIKNLIIQNYLNEIKTYKSAPSVILGSSGGDSRASSKKAVADMTEAKELAKKFFQ